MASIFPGERKHRNKPTDGPTPDGGKRRYDSIKEARYAEQLCLRCMAGDVASWEPNVSIRLMVNGIPLRPYNGKKDAFYRADFIITHLDGSIEVHDTKGRLDSRNPDARLYMLKLGILQIMHPDWRITVG